MPQAKIAREKETTDYSEKVAGARGNYNWRVCFDVTDGYLGITQYEGEKVKDRVLLSPDQVKKMVEFYQG